ncbi:hypothetical protein DL770_004749 [Monosporascus sp. CRB-9-2]|nr:hypothetical protein DL770_004749 [Monosporascus sp. CRB-9-2]
MVDISENEIGSGCADGGPTEGALSNITGINETAHGPHGARQNRQTWMLYGYGGLEYRVPNANTGCPGWSAGIESDSASLSEASRQMHVALLRLEQASFA